MPGKVGGITDTPSSGESHDSPSWFFFLVLFTFLCREKSTIHWCFGFVRTSYSLFANPLTPRFMSVGNKTRTSCWLVGCWLNVQMLLNPGPAAGWKTDRQVKRQPKIYLWHSEHSQGTRWMWLEFQGGKTKLEKTNHLVATANAHWRL